VPIFPPSRAGDERAIDFEVPLRPPSQTGIIFQPGDGPFSAMPGSFWVLLGAADI